MSRPDPTSPARRVPRWIPLEQPSITLEADDLPAVQDAIREYGDLRAAEALRDAAEELARPRTGLAGLLDMASNADQQRATHARWLRARAAALRGEAGR